MRKIKNVSTTDMVTVSKKTLVLSIKVWERQGVWVVGNENRLRWRGKLPSCYRSQYGGQWICFCIDFIDSLIYSSVLSIPWTLRGLLPLASRRSSGTRCILIKSVKSVQRRTTVMCMPSFCRKASQTSVLSETECALYEVESRKSSQEKEEVVRAKARRPCRDSSRLFQTPSSAWLTLTRWRSFSSVVVDTWTQTCWSTS